jgi:transposase
MDFLEANKEALEQALYYRVADLLSLDVEILFYDTTSLHFEIDDEDEGNGNGEVHGSLDAGRKTCAAPRKRGHSKNGRGDAPQIVAGLAVTRDGFPVRHWVFPGNTVDVITVAQIKEDLKGWQLSRCLFAGDAGMVSQANFQALAKGGGKYLMAMPAAESRSPPNQSRARCAAAPPLQGARQAVRARSGPGPGSGGAGTARVGRRPGARP